MTISRINASLTYPCNFMFVASMNPCPCGFYGSQEKECTCSSQAIARYIGKISGPLLDRIDMQIEVTPVKYQKLDSEEIFEEIVSLLHCYSMKMYSKRKCKKIKEVLDEKE